MRAVLIVAFSALASSSGCSVIIDWDPEKLACDSERRCLENYSCLGVECVGDYSREIGTQCSRDIQCEQGAICDLSRFTCYKPCAAASFYRDASSDCEPGEYCAPHLHPSTGEYRGTCVPSECEEDQDCVDPGEPAGRVCVTITSGASACLVGCDVIWTGVGGAEYSDTCGSTPGELKVCQPLGLSGAERLVCLPTTNTAQGEGSICKPVDQPCRNETSSGPVTGLACIEGTCERHCKVSGDGEQCEDSDVCTSVVNASSGVTYGICQAP